MTNTATDIIPPHGFIHKPSTLWPAHPKPEGGYTRVIPTKTKPPPEPGHAHKLKPSVDEARGQVDNRLRQSVEHGSHFVPHASELEDNAAEIPSQKEMLALDRSALPTERSHPDGNHIGTAQDGPDQGSVDVALDFWEPKPPKVLMEDPNSVSWELHAQIQLYATTEQLSHPLVSPVLQGSLGNLCPLYILAGDGECLRDEIIYLAHKAANPKGYPARQGVLRDGNRQKENAVRFQTPTKVHLQVFDDMCHVLTVFTFTEPVTVVLTLPAGRADVLFQGKYAYRSIAQFVKHVIDTSEEELGSHSFPELGKSQSRAEKLLEQSRSIPHKQTHWESDGHKEDEGNQPKAAGAEKESRPESESSGSTSHRENESIGFIRERVNPRGEVRPMECAEELSALRLQPSEIGLIKEQLVRRWLAGQESWDKRFKKQASAVVRKRRHYEAKWEKLLEHAKQDGLFGDGGSVRSTNSAVSTGGTIEPHRRWGPLDLENERPPPSAIAGRKDTREAVTLLKSVLYHSAPRTHQHVPKLRTSDVMRGALDPTDSALKRPLQSVSEQQIRTWIASVHGLKVWQSIVEVFMQKSSKKVADGGKRAASTLHSAGEKVATTNRPEHSQPTSSK